MWDKISKFDKILKYFMNKVKISEESCIGCGLCASLCNEVFELKGGTASIKEGVDVKKNLECIKDAVSNCPTKSIKITKTLIEKN